MYIFDCGPYRLCTKENGSQIEQELELAQEYLDTLEYEQAIALYEQILAIDPTNRDALLGLSKAYTGIAGTEDDFEKEYRPWDRQLIMRNRDMNYIRKTQKYRLYL